MTASFLRHAAAWVVLLGSATTAPAIWLITAAGLVQQSTGAMAALVMIGGFTGAGAFAGAFA